MDDKKPPSAEVLARIDAEWPALRKVLHAIAFKHVANWAAAEDVVAESYRGIRSGSRAWDHEKDPDFAVFAGMVVVSNARHWLRDPFNRRRAKGTLEETEHRRTGRRPLDPEQMAIVKQEFRIAFDASFRKGSPEDRLFELVLRGVTDPALQARALGVSLEEVRALIGRINRVCNNVIEKKKDDEP